MEITVCILTTLFFAALEIWNLKTRFSKMVRKEYSDTEFLVVPHRRHG